MQIPQQLLRTLVALVVTYVLAFAMEAVNVLSAAQVAGEMGMTEVLDLPADSAFDYMKRLQPGRLMLERMEAKAGCLESPGIDEVGRRSCGTASRVWAPGHRRKQ